VVTPDDAVSPMDAASTQQIPRAVVAALDTGADQADSTMVIPASMASGQDDRTQPQPHPRARQPVQQPMPQRQNQQAPNHQQPRTHPPTAPVPAPVSGQSAEIPPQPARSPEEEQQPQPREMGGLVPTVQQPGTQRSLLSRRLDGQ
jgi:hypothetical protein